MSVEEIAPTLFDLIVHMKKIIGIAAFVAAIVMACVEPDDNASVMAVLIYATIFLLLLVTAVLCINTEEKK